MLLLIFSPAFALAGFLHAVLQECAPSNILIRRVKAAPPRWRTAAGLLLLAYALTFVVRAGELAIADGASTWLSYPVGILAWDAIKVSVLALIVVRRRILMAVRHWPRSPAKAQHNWAPPDDADAWQLGQDGAYER